MLRTNNIPASAYLKRAAMQERLTLYATYRWRQSAMDIFAVY